ncbi:MAG: tyrosine-type recombinase/integrase [Candidatus Bipolaricaulaceae bacterium]
MEALRHWRERQAQVVGKAPAHVFTTLEGRPLQPRYVQAMVARYAAKAGIEKRVHPHTLRHSFATDLLRQVGNVEIVRRALGHANLSTTQVYVHLVDADLEAALKSLRLNRRTPPKGGSEKQGRGGQRWWSTCGV